MRLLKLELMNLASLDRQGGEVINFEEGALKDCTIFSIVGKTGSGKSTILDAICLALYNRAPRYPKDGRKNVNRIVIYGQPEEGESNRPAPSDNKNILTRGMKVGYSKLTFLANNGVVYRAEWTIRRKTKNIEDPVTTLYKITQVEGTQVEEEAEWDKLPQIIGLDYDQFLRTVLIAQGSFANFLTCKEDERYELLEKLIGCEEMYSSIAVKIKEKKEAAMDAYKALSADFSAFEKQLIKDPEELQGLVDRIAILEKAEVKAKAELTQIAESLSWYGTEESFQQNMVNYQQAVEYAKRKMESIQQDVEKLVLHDTTLTAVGYYKEIQHIQSTIQAQDAECKALMQKQAATEQTLAEENRLRTVLQQAVDMASDTYKTQKPHIDRARVMKGELAISNRLVTEKTEAERGAADAEKKAVKAVADNALAIQRAHAACDVASQNLDKLSAEIESQVAKLQETVALAVATHDAENQLLEKQDATALQAAKSKAEKMQSDLKEAIRIRKTLEEHAEQRKQQDGRVEELGSRNKAIDEELGLLTIEKLTQELESLHVTFTLMTSENWEEHRSHLAEGEACPLCGSVHHPYADKQVLTPVVHALNEMIQEKQRELNQQNEKKIQLNKEKSSNEGELKSIYKLMDKLAEDRTKLQEDWNALHRIYPDWEEDLSALSARKTAVDEEARLQQELLTTYNELDRRVRKLRTAKDNAEQSFNQYKKKSDADLKQAETKLAEAKALLLSEEGKTENLLQQREEKKRLLEDARQTLTLAKQEVEGKLLSIKQEIGEKDPDGYEQELQNAQSRAQEAVKLKDEAITQLREDLKGLQGTIESVSKNRENLQNSLNNTQKQLADWLTAYNAQSADSSSLSEADIAMLYAATDDWEGIRSMQQKYKALLISADTTLQNETRNHEAHQQKKPVNDKEWLVARKAEIESQKHDELIEAKKRKELHDDAWQKMGSLGTKLEEAVQLKDEWEEITGAIGSDGKTLRKIAQCYTLRFLIEHANQEIRRFNSRYELQQVRNSLGIRVIDHDRADDVRDVTSLSGGETFIVSLGLALGLSTLSSRNISFENLFIDEGFGTLDPDTLDSVIDSLAMLQTLQGKKVGVISHTETMSERIATQIRIVKNGNSGSSHVEIVP